jgi:lipid A 3-O-deacylase
MNYTKTFFLLLALLYNSLMHAQVIDPTASYSSISGDHYFRFSYDNDYFTKMDYYYTQGINLEYVHPGLRRFPLAKLLVKLPNSTYKYGLALDHIGYTPTSILSSRILYGDRPYSSTLTLKTFTISTDAARRQQLSASLILGVVGPAAFGEEMQTGIHRWLKNPLPQGWQYQVKNDVIINYQVNYDKNIWSPGNGLQFSGAAEARVGTFQQRLSGGLTLMAGHFNDPYQSNKSEKKWQYYFFGHPQANLVGYDASLQGGIFNRESPYTISAADINRLTLQGDAGIVVSSRKIYLSYCQSILTKEFRTGAYHRWGGIRFGLSF